MRCVFNKFIALLLILTAVTGCRGGSSGDKADILKRSPYNPDTEEITRVVITFARDLEEDYDLFLYNSHAVIDESGTIKKVRIDFTSQMSIELCEARAMLVDVVEGYLERFRDHSILRGVFGHRPVSIEDLEIHITFESYFNKYVDPTYTAYIILENGMSFFYNSELNAPYTDIWMQKVEPYFKTKQIVTFRREAEIPYEKHDETLEERLLDEERLYIKSSPSSSVMRG